MADTTKENNDVGRCTCVGLDREAFFAYTCFFWGKVYARQRPFSVWFVGVAEAHASRWRRSRAAPDSKTALRFANWLCIIWGVEMKVCE